MNDMEYLYTDKSHNMDAEQDGSDIVYHEMNDLDSDAGQEDVSSTAGLDGLDRTVGFWPRSRKQQKYSWINNCVPSFCRKFTGRELFLLCISSLLALVLVIIVVLSLPSDKQVCTSRACVVVAGQMAGTMDESVDPCEDFYEFSCGSWKKNNPIPSGHSYWDSFAIQKRAIETALKIVLEQKFVNNTEQSSERKAKLFYNTCLDLPAINKHGKQPIKDLIQEVGGWSVDGRWNRSSFDLNSLLRRVAAYGTSTYYSIAVGTDLKNVSNNILMVGEGALNLGKRKFYLNKTLDDQVLRAYLGYMTEICVLLDGDETNSRKLMGSVLRLEQRIAEIQMPVEKARNRDLYYKYTTIPEIQDISPEVQWMDVVNSLFSEAITGETIGASEKIGTSAVDYLTELTEILRTTSNETLNNYVIWQLVSTFIPALGEDFLKLRSKFTKEVYGSDSSCIERWRWCVSATDSSMGLALGKLFVEKDFDHDSRDMAQHMVTEIKSAFKRNLPKMTWLDKETELKAVKKVDAVRDMIGYPDYILNQTRVDEDYSDFHLDQEMSYFEMIVALHKFANSDNLKDLRKPVDKTDWEMTPPTINAYYNPTDNTIVFPAGILQPPAYSSNYPQSVNFGGIGLVVGHELTHGFDDEGRKYGVDGNLDNWWKNETVKKFQKKAECMIEQYSKYEIVGQNVNGNLTIGENIADNGGLRLAYDAYMQWRETGAEAEDPLLPSLMYTREQLFFIAFAQLWCSVSTPQHMKESTLLGTHSPNKIRVIGVASNSPEFADAFKCPSGSPMNPVKKCRVW